MGILVLRQLVRYGVLGGRADRKVGLFWDGICADYHCLVLVDRQDVALVPSFGLHTLERWHDLSYDLSSAVDGC